jgi:hypothetical protein
MDAGVRIRLEESLKTHIGAKRKRNIASVVSCRSALSSTLEQNRDQIEGLIESTTYSRCDR